MAKAQKKEVIVSDEGVQLVSDELTTKLKGNLKKKEDKIQTDLGEVSILAVEEPKTNPVKMVKILMKDNHKCYIGGEWYYLLADKHYNVPENVKNVLMKANKLRPL